MLHAQPQGGPCPLVDARQELDLKVGVAFTRYLTSRFLPAAKIQCGSAYQPAFGVG